MPAWWEPHPSFSRNSRAARQITLMRQNENILERIAKQGIVLGDGGYLIELERRGWVDSGSGRERVGTGKGSGQFTPEVAIEHPDALRELYHEFLNSGSQVLQALTFFGTREKLNRAGYGEQTEAINAAAVRIAREVAGSSALVAGSVSRTQLFEREGPTAAGQVRDQITHLSRRGGAFSFKKLCSRHRACNQRAASSYFARNTHGGGIDGLGLLSVPGSIQFFPRSEESECLQDLRAGVEKFVVQLAQSIGMLDGHFGCELSAAFARSNSFTARTAVHPATTLQFDEVSPIA